MKRPICCNCCIEMKREKNGATALYLAFNPPAPYQAWHVDLFKCPLCGHETLSGFAGNAYWHHSDDEPAPETDDKYVFLVYEHPRQSPVSEESGITQIQINTKNEEWEDEQS